MKPRLDPDDPIYETIEKLERAATLFPCLEKYLKQARSDENEIISRLNLNTERSRRPF